MKIYRSVTIDIVSGQVLQADCFEYAGPMTWCGGSPDTDIDETPEEKMLAQVAMEQWKHYGDTFYDVENEYMDMVSNLQSDAVQNFQQGQAAATAQGAFSDTLTEAKGLFGQGIDPSSGRFSGAVTTAGLQLGMDSAGAQNDVAAGLRQDYATGLQNIVNIGLGESTEALQGFSDMASDAAEEEILDAQIEAQSTDVASTALGLGLGAVTGWALGDDE